MTRSPGTSSGGVPLNDPCGHWYQQLNPGPTEAVGGFRPVRKEE